MQYYYILCVHNDAGSVLDRLYKSFKLNPGSVGDPDIYLGVKFKKISLENGLWAWAMSLARYFRDPFKNSGNYLLENMEGSQCIVPKREENSFAIGYCWEKSIKGKSINGQPMHAERAHYGVCRKKCFI